MTTSCILLTAAWPCYRRRAAVMGNSYGKKKELHCRGRMIPPSVNMSVTCEVSDVLRGSTRRGYVDATDN